MNKFKLVRKHLAMGGIEMPQKLPPTYPMNVKNSTICFILFVFVAMIAASLKDANTFDECTDILFKSVSIGACSTTYAIVVWKSSILFEFVNHVSEIVKLREFTVIFLRINFE